MKDNTKIDITGLDKAEVLVALFNEARRQGIGFFAGTGQETLDIETARELLVGKRPYIDYLMGRVIKTGFHGDILDTALYNRDNGPNAGYEALILAGLIEGQA